MLSLWVHCIISPDAGVVATAISDDNNYFSSVVETHTQQIPFLLVLSNFHHQRQEYSATVYLLYKMLATELESFLTKEIRNFRAQYRLEYPEISSY